MKIQITGQVPTIYQYSSLKTLTSGPVTKNPGGSFTFIRKFDTKREAQQFLRERAYNLAENVTELRAMLAQISKYGQLEYDAAVVRIERIYPD